MFGIDDILLGSVISGAASFLGGERRNDAAEDAAQANNYFNAQQAQINRDYNSQEATVAREFNRTEAGVSREWSSLQAQRAMDFQREMSDTQWQRGMKDMMKAGLNPMLAVMKGGAGGAAGASGSTTAASAGHASSSSASSSGNPQVENSVGQGVTSALETARAMGELDARRQDMLIKQPLVKGSEMAGTGIDAVRSLLSPVSESVSDAVRAIEDKVRDGSLSSGASDRVQEVISAAGSFADDVAGRILEPIKAVGKASNSAARIDSLKKGVRGGYKLLTEPETRSEFLDKLIRNQRKRNEPSRDTGGNIPREHQRRFKEYEWKFNYTPQRDPKSFVR